MDRIGKYEILDKIGSGGFAIVYKGYDPFIKRPVAIKVCYSREEETRQRFYREAEIAGRLVHRNITTVYDFGLHEQIPYLVEEYLPGEDLAHLIHRHEPETLDEKLDILLQITNGLDYAHSQGIIHRDVKPGNIRVLDSGRIKIMDFGTAKLADVESQLTQAGMTLGTVAYLSPERLLGQESGLNSDIFSFGVLAYELLSFTRPFPAENIPALIDRMLHEPPIQLVESWSECPPQLATIVHRCLEKEPADRYLACTEVILDLERFRDEHSAARIGAPPEPPDGTAVLPQIRLQLAALLERARELVDRGRRERAQLLLEEVLEIDPDHLEARELLAATRAPAPEEEESAAERRERKIAEAVESIEAYLASGHVIQAGEALSFAVRLFGAFDEAPAISGRILGVLRRELDAARNEGKAAAGRFLALLESRRDAGRLPFAEAERIVRWVEELDPDDRAAAALLDAVPRDAPPVAAGDLTRTEKEAEAAAAIERLLAEGRPKMARDALAFAVQLFGRFEAVAGLEQRILAALDEGEGG